ncbi:hypothetical protein [Nocardioides immobilis]|nr:hypothetical protein [Nocardioides immobilis]
MNESSAGLEMIRTGIYWQREVYDLARSAYVADLDATPAGPAFFVDWLRCALDEHAARTPEARADRAANLPEVTAGCGFNQMYPLPAGLLEQVKEAITEDRKQLGRASSRSAFAREAVLVAVEAARRRRGGTLPPPNQLPNRRPRRYP